MSVITHQETGNFGDLAIVRPSNFNRTVISRGGWGGFGTRSAHDLESFAESNHIQIGVVDPPHYGARVPLFGRRAFEAMQQGAESIVSAMDFMGENVYSGVATSMGSLQLMLAADQDDRLPKIALVAPALTYKDHSFKLSARYSWSAAKLLLHPSLTESTLDLGAAAEEVGEYVWSNKPKAFREIGEIAVFPAKSTLKRLQLKGVETYIIAAEGDDVFPLDVVEIIAGLRDPISNIYYPDISEDPLNSRRDRIVSNLIRIAGGHGTAANLQHVIKYGVAAIIP